MLVVGVKDESERAMHTGDARTACTRAAAAETCLLTMAVWSMHFAVRNASYTSL